LHLLKGENEVFCETFFFREDECYVVRNLAIAMMKMEQATVVNNVEQTKTE